MVIIYSLTSFVDPMVRPVLLCLMLMVFAFASPEYALADRNTRAQKAILEGEFTEAVEQLDRSLEKDTLNPGAYFLYAILFSTDSFPQYSVDSAHWFVLKSLDQFDLTNEDLVKEMNRLEVSIDSLKSLKAKIDGMAYQEATTKHTIAGYEYFMAIYPNASQYPDAVANRNAIAFEKAQAAHTWQSYQQFFETYPEAVEVPEAKSLYEKLLFEDKTQGNTLAAFQTFLRNYPETPYRKRTEKAILEIVTASNNPSAYLSFLKQYPGTVWARQAMNVLYYLPKNDQEIAEYQSLQQRYGLQDSLEYLGKNSSEALITIYDDAYGFMNQQGEVVIKPTYSNVPEDYLCGNITSDYLEVQSAGITRLIARNDHLIYEGAVDYSEELGLGLILIENEDGVQVIHKSGFRIALNNPEDVSLLDGTFLVYEADGIKQMATFLGKPMVISGFDDVEVLGQYYIFYRDDLVAIKTKSQLLPAADEQPVNLDFRFEEVELLRQHYLFAAVGDQEVVFDQSLNEVVPLAEHQIFPMDSGWLIKQPFGYRIQHDQDTPEEARLYDRVLYNENWNAFKEAELWRLISKTDAPVIKSALDSVYILSDNMAYAIENEEEKVFFLSGNEVTVSKGDQFTILGPRNNPEAQENYLLVKNGTICRLYTPTGKEVFKARMDDMKYLVPGFFEIKLNKLSGVIDTKGQIPIWPKYEAIAPITDSLIMVLDNGNFDVFDLYKEKLIARYFDQRIIPYNAAYLIVSKSGQKGLIETKTGREVLDTDYEDIQFWTDSTALVAEGDTYQIINIETEDVLFDGIREYNFVRQASEESIIKYLGDDGFGIYSSKHGVVLQPEYNDIVNLGTPEKPIYFSEQHLPKASFYVVTYTDATGNVIRSQAFRPDAYEKIFCDL